MQEISAFVLIKAVQGPELRSCQCSGPVEHWLWVRAEKGTTEHGRLSPKVTLRTARPGEEGEEKPNLPLLLAQGLQGILSATSGAKDCCFIHGPKPRPETLRQ